jgi:hypothetical protein
MLAAQWFPAQTVGSLPPTCRPEPREDVAVSRDLGLVRIAGPEHELIVRTESQMTSWDRRYLGPTILRYSRGDELLVGAISRTVSTDLAPRSDRPSNRLLRIVDLFRHRYTNGAEHLDAVTVGYVPVLRNGATDWVPYRAMDVETSPGRLVTRHGMERVRVRGFYPCMVEALQLAHGNVPGLKPKRYVRPPMRPADGIQLERSIQLDARRCRIEDRITGAPRTARLLFSVRRLPSAIVDVDGLKKRQTIVGWGSDGRHTLDIYESPVAHAEVRYACEIREA